MWILIDVSNGDALDIRNASKIYFWSFETKSAAQKHKRNVKRQKHGAELIGPFLQVEHFLFDQKYRHSKYRSFERR